jgi:hypothetical protein
MLWSDVLNFDCHAILVRVVPIQAAIPARSAVQRRNPLEQDLSKRYSGCRSLDSAAGDQTDTQETENATTPAEQTKKLSVSL